MNDSRTQQVLLVGPNKKVLEIGPGTGMVTRALRKRGCEVTCVEINAKAYRAARKYSNRVIHADIETLDLRKALKEKYDVILFGDVLEHLKDPNAVLRRVRPYLKRTGQIVATVPNIAHGSVRLLMLDGNLDRKPTGLLDSTHLHFYTRKTLIELLSVSGYSVQLVKEIKLPIHAAEHLKVDVGKYPPDLIRAIESDPDASVYQFAVTARPVRMQAGGRRVTRRRRPVSKSLMVQDTADPLSAVLTIYHARRDLQLAFPEVRHGEYSKLLQWASTSTADNSRGLVDRYLPWYRTNAISLKQDLENQLQLKDDHIQNLDTRTKDLENQLRAIENSLAWRLVKRYRKFNDKWFPAGTKRSGLVDRCALAVRVTLDEGLSSLSHRVVRRYLGRPSIDEQYHAWLKNNELTNLRLLEMKRESSSFIYKPKISIIMPVHDVDEKWLRAAIDSVVHQIYQNWELCIVDDGSTKKHIKRVLDSYAAREARIRIRYLKENRGIAAASNEACSMAEGDFVGFLDHDDELSIDALFEVVRLLNQSQNLDLIYSDEDKIDLKGRKVEPFFKPDWSPDLLRSMNYICHFVTMRKSLIDKVGGLRSGFEGSQDYDLLLRIAELTDRIGHIPRPLYSWRKVPGSAAASTEAKPLARETAKRALVEALSRRGLKGEVLGGPGNYHRVRYAIQGNPLVSIIIPTRDRVDLLRRCIERIERKTSHRNYEVIIVDNGSKDPTTLSYLESTRHRVLKFDEPFNFSRLNNFGAAHAKGEHLLFLNNDTEVADDHWLEAMLEHSQRPDVGMVGALLLYPNKDRSNRMIQHAGVNVGVGGVAGHAFKYLSADRDNYFNLHRVVRDCSAVTAACAMIKRSVFEEVDGFDERLRVAFGDVDLCLRLREKGYLVVYTPYAILHHYETATRGKLHPMEDEDYMITRWKDILFKGDPYYNPNLTLLREDYTIASKGSSIRPLAILLDIYYLRPDLQKAFPEARNGDYQRLSQWAATYGTTIDAVHVPLRAYASFYTSHLSNHVEPSQPA